MQRKKSLPLFKGQLDGLKKARKRLSKEGIWEKSDKHLPDLSNLLEDNKY